MTFHDRETTRRTRTASEERFAILLAVIVGVAVQAFELLVVIALLYMVFEAL
jgi:hypothetical protein